MVGWGWCEPHSGGEKHTPVVTFPYGSIGTVDSFKSSQISMSLVCHVATDLQPVTFH